MGQVVGAILALGFLIMVHEAGHLIVARWCGMKVERFSIGFGPGIFRWRSKKDTIYQIAPIPFGGFVEIKVHLLPRPFSSRPFRGFFGQY